MTDQYHPLVNDVAQSSRHIEKHAYYDVEVKEVVDHDDDEDEDEFELKEVDLSRLPEESRPRWYMITILPRYMQPGGLKVKKELHPTAYLDAVRGWAALAVFRYHGHSK